MTRFEKIIKKDYKLYILIGLIQAILLIILLRLPLAKQFIPPLVSFILITNTTLLLSFKVENLFNSIIASIALGIIYLLITISNDQIFPIIFTQIISLYIAIPFIQNWINKKDSIFDYKDLFYHSWNNYFIVFIATILIGIFWLLILLCGGLFSILGIPLIKIFVTPIFLISSISILFALGIYIGRKNYKIVHSLRTIVIALCNILLPLVISITILFGLSLLLMGMEPLFKTGKTTTLLIILISSTIFFINGIFQDGTRKEPLNKYLIIATNITIFTLPVYSVIALYAIYLRIDQYGLTPDRFLVGISTLIISFYSIAYTYCAYIKSTVWLEEIKKVNTVLSFIVFIVILAINTPILNADKYAAMNQYNRLISGKVDASKFDYEYLNYGLGGYGKEYVKKLESLKNHRQINIIKERLEILKNPKDKIGIFKPVNGEVIPQSLLRFLQSEFGDMCEKTCSILFINLDKDSDMEVLVISKFVYASFVIDKNKEEQWKKVGTLGGAGYALKNDVFPKYRAIDNEYKSLQFGDVVLYFRSENNF